MRYTCEEPFAGAFVEYSDAWSMRDRRLFISDKGDEWLDLIRGKVTALHLPAMEGEPLTSAEHLTVENLERLDGRLFDWWRATPGQCLVDLRRLGEALRPSSAIAAKA